MAFALASKSACSAVCCSPAAQRVSRRPAVRAAAVATSVQRVAVNHGQCATIRPRLSSRSAVVVKAAMNVGDKLSDSADFYRVLKASDGSNVTLASLKGKNVVLFFYPKASTPGCTKEACKFRDEYEAFTKAGAVVYGISSDDPATNKAFADAQRLPFPLLTDPSSILRKNFGVKGDFLGLLPGRQTFVFDKEGRCIMSFNDQLNAEKHVEEALAALKAKAFA